MKYLIVVIIAALAFAAADEEWKPPNETADEISNKCIAESGITREQRAKIGNKDRPEDKEIYEYILCGVKKFGVFTEDRGYHIDRIMTLFASFELDEGKVREILKECVDSNEQKSTPAVWAYRGIECLIQTKKMDELFKEAEDRMRNKKLKEA